MMHVGPVLIFSNNVGPLVGLSDGTSKSMNNTNFSDPLMRLTFSHSLVKSLNFTECGFFLDIHCSTW